MDLGILARTDEVWPSDNTDALDRQNIQFGYTQAYTPQTMVAWVTDVPSMDQRLVPLQYRFLVAMQGALGIGANLAKFSDAEMALSAKLTAFYKTIRTTVQQGRLYHRPCCLPICIASACCCRTLRFVCAGLTQRRCIRSARSIRTSIWAKGPCRVPCSWVPVST